MINRDEVYKEALAHFQALLRMDTSNPPGNEIQVARYVEGVLRKEGIESSVIESAPGRGNIVARLKGSGSAGSLILTSHFDVVPAEAGKWSHPPFSGEIADGFVWGRGAVDMKNMTAYTLMTMLLLKRSGAKLKRDVVFVGVADEEAGCEYGMQFLVEKHPELLEAEYALNEVGGFTLHVGGSRLYPVQVAEKGFVWLKLTAKGDPGHGSIPHDNNAVVKLSEALKRIGERPFPLHVTPEARQFISAIASHLPFPRSLVLGLTMNPMFSDFVLRKVIPDKDQANVFHACLHNTVSPTQLSAGQKVNVIPSEAQALLDCRIVPGQTVESFLTELRAVIGNDMEIEIIKSALPAITPLDTPLYSMIKEVVEEQDPGSKVVPYLVVGFTDAKQLERLGIKTYGFSPVKFPPDLLFSKLFHGHNERIPLDGFQWGLKTFYAVVERFCT